MNFINIIPKKLLGLIILSGLGVIVSFILNLFIDNNFKEEVYRNYISFQASANIIFMILNFGFFNSIALYYNKSNNFNVLFSILQKHFFRIIFISITLIILFLFLNNDYLAISMVFFLTYFVREVLNTLTKTTGYLSFSLVAKLIIPLFVILLIFFLTSINDFNEIHIIIVYTIVSILFMLSTFLFYSKRINFKYDNNEVLIFEKQYLGYAAFTGFAYILSGTWPDLIYLFYDSNVTTNEAAILKTSLLIFSPILILNQSLGIFLFSQFKKYIKNGKDFILNYIFFAIINIIICIIYYFIFYNIFSNFFTFSNELIQLKWIGIIMVFSQIIYIPVDVLMSTVKKGHAIFASTSIMFLFAIFTSFFLKINPMYVYFYSFLMGNFSYLISQTIFYKNYENLIYEKK
tara:strand:- start:129 stop:1340 length:1212 start_codon:yes stop_codon:yes gene_type:complete